MRELVASEVLISAAAHAAAAASAKRLIARNLPSAPRKGRVGVFALGEAAALMAQAVEESWGDLGGRLFGVCVGPNRAGNLKHIEPLVGGRPTPDASSVQAAERMLSLAAPLGPADFALALISEGGSSLACAPIDGFDLQTKAAITDALMKRGATAAELNAIRKRLSRIKGGGLAAAIAPARSLTLAVSSGLNNDASLISSGPTVPDSSNWAEADAIFARYHLGAAMLTPPGALGAPLKQESNQPAFHYVSGGGVPLAFRPEPYDAAHPIFAQAQLKLLSKAAAALAAAQSRLESQGYAVDVLKADALEHGPQEAAASHTRKALSSPSGAALICGGEALAGRTSDALQRANRKYAIALALALRGAPNISALVMNTGGARGALLHPNTLTRAAQYGVDPSAALAGEGADGFFSTLGDTFYTGPVDDSLVGAGLKIILVQPA